MSKNRMFYMLALIIFIISAVLFYQVGNWKLVLAIILFGWALNLENSTK